jgi:hypothetical protein
VWVGGRARTVALVEEIGAAVNLWDAGPEEVASIHSRNVIEVTWGGIAGRGPGGPAEPTFDQMVDHLVEIGTAGATWAVSVWPSSVEQFAEVAGEVRRRLGSAGL